MKTIVLAAVALMLLPVASYAEPQKTKQDARQETKAMQEGSWEITVKVEMEGVPFPMPPMTHTECITKEDRKDVKKTLPSPTADKNECEVKSHKVVGNKISWQVQCKDGTTGAGEMVTKATSYTGTMTMETANKEQGASKIVQHITGKRVGDCK